MTALVVQSLLGAGLLLASVWLLQAAAAEALATPGCDDFLDLFIARDPRSGKSLLSGWLALNSAAIMLPIAGGTWLTFGLSHWRRSWLRIPAWLAAETALLTLIWAYPIADRWWQGGSVSLGGTDVFVAALELTGLTSPLLAIFLPFERAVLRHVNEDSIISDLLRRRSRRRGLRHGKQVRR